MFGFLQGRLILVRLIMLGAMFALIGIGVAMIFAAGNPADAEGIKVDVPSGAWQKQLVYAGGGLIFLILLNLIDYRWLGPLSYWIYGAVVVVLAVLLLGKVFNIPFIFSKYGAYRWIRIGIGSHYVQVQPSEFCKVAYILALAWYLRFRSNYRHFSGLVGPFALTMLAMVLILLEPDLGTVMLMMPVLFTMLFVAGAKARHLTIILLLGAMCFPFLWGKMNFYQRQRISSMLLQNERVMEMVENDKKIAKILTGQENFNEREWSRGYGWQLKHSKLAISSGGMRGYGLRHGPYIRYNSLPERHNDFIFSIIAHQWGLWGCLLVFGLYAVIMACGIEIAWHNTDAFARLISVGIIAMFAVEVIVNVSMTMGLMPITGLTLPLVSYGGSSLVVHIAAIGLLNSVGKERPFSVAGRAFESVGQ